MDYAYACTIAAEVVSLTIYALIMLILTFSKNQTFATKFFSQSWILGVFDISCYFFNVILRILRDTDADIKQVYSVEILTKMMTDGHQITMLLINISRFRLLYNPTSRSGDASLSTSKLLWGYRLRRLIPLLILAILVDFHRVVLIFIHGWPDYNYNYDLYTVDFVNRVHSSSAVFVPCVFCAFLNLIIVWKWSKDNLFSNKEASCRNGKQFAYAGLIVVISLPLTVYQCLKFYDTLMENDTLVTSVTNFFDVSYFPFLFGNAFILLWMNKDLRRTFIGIFKRPMMRKQSSKLSSVSIIVEPRKSIIKV